jgi:hypothetical protein
VAAREARALGLDERAIGAGAVDALLGELDRDVDSGQADDQGDGLDRVAARCEHAGENERERRDGR